MLDESSPIKFLKERKNDSSKAQTEPQLSIKLLSLLCPKNETILKLLKLLTIPDWNNFWVVVVWLFCAAFLPPNFCNNLDELLPPALGNMLFWPRNAATDERRLRLGAFRPVIEPGKSRPRLSVGHLVLSYKDEKEKESCIVSGGVLLIMNRFAPSGI